MHHFPETFIKPYPPRQPREPGKPTMMFTSVALVVFARLGVGTKSSSHSSTVNDVARCEFHPHAYVSPEDVTANEFLLPDAIAATSATSTRRGASTE